MFMERTPLKNFLSRTLLKTKIKTIEQKVLIICKNILEENPFENFLSRSLKKTKIKPLNKKF
jgi:hypothetical protein